MSSSISAKMVSRFRFWLRMEFRGFFISWDTVAFMRERNSDLALTCSYSSWLEMSKIYTICLACPSCWNSLAINCTNLAFPTPSWSDAWEIYQFLKTLGESITSLKIRFFKSAESSFKMSCRDKTLTVASGSYSLWAACLLSWAESTGRNICFRRRLALRQFI